MSRNSRLNVNENTLPSGSQNTLQALISVGLLSKQNTRISFRHQLSMIIKLALSSLMKL